MTPSPGASASPLPPLPDLQGASGTGAGQTGGPPPGLMSALVSGIAPVKNAVDGILAGCKSIVQSGAVPGAEQICSQIVALATSLLPMAAQSALQPGGAQGGASIPAVAPGPGGPPPGAGAAPPMMGQ